VRGERATAICLALLAACAAEAPSVVKTASRPKPPPWIVKAPTAPDAAYFSGSRENAASLEEGTTAATEAARAHAAEFLGVNVSAEHLDVQSTEIASDRVQDTVRSRTTALIRSAKVDDVYYEKYSRTVGATSIDAYDVWVLVKLPMAELATERERQKQEEKAAAQTALTGLREAQAEEKAGHALAALARYRDAAAQAKRLSAAVETGDAQLRTGSQLRKAAEDAAARTQANVRRAAVVAPDWVAGALAEALSASGFSSRTFAEEREAVVEARAQGVPWVIVVKATTSAGGQVFTQVAATASLDVRALDTRSGDVVASAQKQAKAVGRTPAAAQQAAANQAALEAGKDLASALVAREGEGL
jgi:hypothetical protein